MSPACPVAFGGRTWNITGDSAEAAAAHAACPFSLGEAEVARLFFAVEPHATGQVTEETAPELPTGELERMCSVPGCSRNLLREGNAVDERTVELACAALEEFLRADRFGARTARQWRPFLSICGAAPGLTFPPMGVFFPQGTNGGATQDAPEPGAPAVSAIS